jgi:PhnB protein
MSVTDPDQPQAPHAHDLPLVTPYLCADDALAAIDFYQSVFGAVVTFPPMIGPDGRVGHCELQIGHSALSLASAYPEEGVLSPLTLGGTPVQLRLEVPDVDDVFARAVAAGATVLREVELAPYGERAGKIRDPFGHNWFLTTVVEELSVAEVNERFEPLGYQTPAADDATIGSEAADQGAGVQDAVASGPHHPDRVLGPDDAGQLFYFTFGVPDGARAEAFFRQLFDWEIMSGSQHDGYHIASPTPPGGIAGGTNQPVITLYFRVADIGQAVARVRQLGGTAEEPVLWASGWSATCRDDQGTPFSLSEPAPGY